MSDFTTVANRRIALFALSLLVASLLGCFGEVRSVESMRESTVRVLVFLPDGRLTSTGSGFVVADGNHIATNYHVVSAGFRADPEDFTIRIGLSNGSASDLIDSKVVWSDKNADVSILTLDTAVDRPISLLALKPTIALGDDVQAIGFPGRTDNTNDFSDPNFYLPTLTDGSIAKMSPQPGAESGGANRDGILHTATVTPGNSGGPLFDRCGRVVGINTLTDVDHDAYNYAFHMEHVVEGLESLDLAATATTETCDPDAASLTLQMAASGAGLLLGFAALVIILRSNSRKAVKEIVSRASDAVSRRIYSRPSRSVGTGGQRREDAPRPAAVLSPVLACLGGDLAGTEIPVSESPIVLGRSPDMANLIFPAMSEGISKRHCTIRFDPDRQVVILEDLYSSFGTFLADKSKLVGGAPFEIRTDTRFFVGSLSQEFEIRMRG